MVTGMSAELEGTRPENVNSRGVGRAENNPSGGSNRRTGLAAGWAGRVSRVTRRVVV